jgi:glutamate-ammonia-ligase adenylyltransferase
MDNTLDPRWQIAIDHSHYLANQLQAHPAMIPELAATWQQPLSEDMLLIPLKVDFADDEAVKSALRRLRHRAMAHMTLRDLCGLATLAEIMESMTLLADVTTNFALDYYHRQLVATYGEPLDRAGLPQRLLIIGMGKLGGRELNVSSDVDYIFVYPGRRRHQRQEKYRKLRFLHPARQAGDQRARRPDRRWPGFPGRHAPAPEWRFRPAGLLARRAGKLFHHPGPRVGTLRLDQGRVMNTGPNADGASLGDWMAALRRISRPFVFRKYLDFGAINAMRDLHAQIRREVARKDMVDHVKLGPGGIREIEFIAQVFQLIRGGRDPALQIRPTLSVLKLLVERKLIPAETESELREAYVFLRRLEHRLQYVEDKQTHMLPVDAAGRAVIARSMDFPDWPAMLVVLDDHRNKVSRTFRTGLFRPRIRRAPAHRPMDGPA